MIDFTRHYPHAYHLRRNILNRAVERFDPTLAAIPYAKTGLPLGYPFAAHFVADAFRRLGRKYLPFVDGAVIREPHREHLEGGEQHVGTLHAADVPPHARHRANRRRGGDRSGRRESWGPPPRHPSGPGVPRP